MKRNFSFNIDNYKIIFSLMLIVLIMVKCKPANEKNTADKTISADTKLVPVSATSLPDAPGAEAFKMNCMICHSESYIRMQPGFPRKTWENIVNKMIKSFGAPIPDSTSQNIVDYLTAIKGKK